MFLYTKNKLGETDIKNTMPIVIAAKKRNYFR